MKKTTKRKKTDSSLKVELKFNLKKKKPKILDLKKELYKDKYLKNNNNNKNLKMKDSKKEL